MTEQYEILINGTSPLFDTRGMQYREYPSDFSKIRLYTAELVHSAPSRIKEFNLLEQQISEIIKNAIKHGNHNDPRKIIKIWYSFTHECARIIVEDQGEGFKDIEKWNAFNRRRLEYIWKGNFDGLVSFLTFRGQDSDDKDGGNALFASLEYWNGGFVFNDKLNAVAAKKDFEKKAQEPLSDFLPWDIEADGPVPL